MISNSGSSWTKIFSVLRMVPTHKFASIICYESIYGSFVRKFSLNGAEFFTIISNDAWWGETEGHKQL